ncbi:MAG: hypothetical protein KDA22_08775, partial [Phycisphaerales bacterium]|nr:hypothetical protein [Phycisphaerales bacterium]
MLHAPLGTGAALAALIFATPLGNDNATWVGPFGGLWNNPGNWSPRVVPLNNGITYFVTVSPPGAGQAIFNVSGSVDLLTIGPDDEVVLANGQSLGIAQGSLTGNGTLTMGSVGNQTDLSFALGESLIDGTIDVVAS